MYIQKHICLILGLVLLGVVAVGLSVCGDTASSVESDKLADEKRESPAARRAGERHGRIAEARKAAKNTDIPAKKRVDNVLAILKEELADPSPDVWIATPWTVSEVIQINAVRALSEVEDINALAAKLKDAQTDRALRKHIHVAIGLTKVSKDNSIQLGLVRELMRLSREDSDDSVRSLAVSALGNLAKTNPDLKDEIVKTLRTVLLDRSARAKRGDVWLLEERPDTEPPLHLVSGEAVRVLIGLGIDKDRVTKWYVEGNSDAAFAEFGVPSGPSSTVRWVLAEGVLGKRDYKLTWDAKASVLKGVRGEIVVELRTDSKTAVVNGRKIELDVAPRVVDGKVQVPVSLLDSLP